MRNSIKELRESVTVVALRSELAEYKQRAEAAEKKAEGARKGNGAYEDRIFELIYDLNQAKERNEQYVAEISALTRNKAEWQQRAEAAEEKLRELEMQNQKFPDSALCAAGVEPCVCAVANNLDAARYRALRNQDIESDFPRSGVFIGKVPDNHCLTGIDADNAVDALFPAPKQEEK